MCIDIYVTSLYDICVIVVRFSRSFSMKATKELTFVTNHGLILPYTSQHPQCTAQEMIFTIKTTEKNRTLSSY